MDLALYAVNAVLVDGRSMREGGERDRPFEILGAAPRGAFP